MFKTSAGNWQLEREVRRLPWRPPRHHKQAQGQGHAVPSRHSGAGGERRTWPVGHPLLGAPAGAWSCSRPSSPLRGAEGWSTFLRPCPPVRSPATQRPRAKPSETSQSRYIVLNPGAVPQPLLRPWPPEEERLPKGDTVTQPRPDPNSKGWFLLLIAPLPPLRPGPTC